MANPYIIIMVVHGHGDSKLLARVARPSLIKVVACVWVLNSRIRLQCGASLPHLAIQNSVCSTGLSYDMFISNKRILQ